MAKKKTYAQLKKDLDKVFSLYIRLKAADGGGFVQCVTCNVIRHYKDNMDNGHYVSRNHLSTRWYEKNCHVQCRGCNRFGNGRLDEYALFLTGEYGPDILWKLNQKKHEQVKFGLPALREMIQTYKDKLNETN